ncbi:tetratricopeptide repeat protein [Cytophagaceae bacterium AH-315-L13]|nr:tetratricopeptide repeat protein [Cytophagaceae bacterium AH-315-L13]
MALFMSKDYEKAMVSFSNTVKYNPKHQLAFLRRGSCQMHLKKYTDAIVDFNKVLSINPRHALALYYRGKAKQMDEIKDYEGALEDLNKSIRYYPYSAYALCYRGIVKMKMGDYDSAWEDFDHSIEVAPDYGKSYYARAECNYLLKFYNDACTDLKKAQSLEIEISDDLASKYCN